MKASLDCIFCMLEKARSMYAEYEPDKHKQVAFIKSVMRIISDIDDREIPPATTARIQRELSRHAGVSDHFEIEKKQSNDLALKIADEIWAHIAGAENPVKQAIKYALAGNFIDFGAYNVINEASILEIIEKAATWEINPKSFERFDNDLRKAENLVYLTDNAGEIVFDKLLIQAMKTRYPKLHIDAIVRGLPILNDATMADAEAIGLTEIVPVIDNGTDIPGTDISLINDESKALIDSADVILSKGMGNFESLYGSSYNVYFAFLCKCQYFTERFKVQLNESIFEHNDTIQAMDLFS